MTTNLCLDVWCFISLKIKSIFLMLCLFTFSSCMLCSSFSLALILMSCQKVLAKCYFLTHGEQLFFILHVQSCVCSGLQRELELNYKDCTSTPAYSIGLIKGFSIIISIVCHNFLYNFWKVCLCVCVVLGIDTRALYVLGKHSITEHGPALTHEF